MRMFRRPQTTSERRATSGHIVEGVYNRGRRKPKKGVPNTYDDIFRVDRYDRSWKKHRHTQYKTVYMTAA